MSLMMRKVAALKVLAGLGDLPGLILARLASARFALK
jgi:hypothetical protein